MIGCGAYLVFSGRKQRQLLGKPSAINQALGIWADWHRGSQAGSYRYGFDFPRLWAVDSRLASPAVGCSLWAGVLFLYLIWPYPFVDSVSIIRKHADLLSSRMFLCFVLSVVKSGRPILSPVFSCEFWNQFVRFPLSLSTYLH